LTKVITKCISVGPKDKTVAPNALNVPNDYESTEGGF